MILALVGDHVGVGVGQLHSAYMDVAIDDVFHDGPDLERFHHKYVVAFQVFNKEMVDMYGEIRTDIQASDPDVCASFGGKVSACDPDGKLLDDRILDADKDGHDGREEHHYQHKDTMDNLFFNNFEPPNYSS